MASEPAEPTTRQALVEKAAQSLHDVRHASFRCTGEPTDQDLDQARALADLGLLADPAQTTELARLRMQVALLGRHLQSSADKDKRIIAWRVEAEQAHQNWEAARAANMTALETIAELRTERDERQARIDAALEWWRQERDADHCWPLSFEDSAKVNSLRYRVYAALIGHPLADQPMRAALAGDQPATEGLKRQPLRRTHALPRLAEGATHELGIALPGEEEYEEVADVSFRREEDWREVDAKIIRDAEERDDAAGDLP